MVNAEEAAESLNSRGIREHTSGLSISFPVFRYVQIVVEAMG
jgi:hypothetical protein